MTYALMGNMDGNMDLVDKGLLQIEPFKTHSGNYNIQVALAVLYSVRANHAGLREQAEIAPKSFAHAEKALALNPNLPHPNFILGRYNFELADMSSATEKIVAQFIDLSELEKVDFDLALSYLKEASRLAPDRFLYVYFTGAANDKLNKNDMAMQYYLEADRKERYTKDDKKASKKLAKILKK